MAVVYGVIGVELLIKGPKSHKQQPHNLLEMFKFVEKQRLRYVDIKWGLKNQKKVKFRDFANISLFLEGVCISIS